MSESGSLSKIEKVNVVAGLGTNLVCFIDLYGNEQRLSYIPEIAGYL